MINEKNITENWIELLDIENKIEYFNDTIIPKVYIYETEYGFFFRQNEERYYFKRIKNRETFLKELLGEKVTLQMSLKSVHYKLAKVKINNNIWYGVISKWERDEKKEYQSLSQWIEKNYHYKEDHLGLIKKIDERFPEEKVCEEFRDFLARDYFTQEYDRSAGEILFEKEQKKTHLGYLLDYGKEFEKTSRTIGINFYYILNLKEEKVVEKIKQDERLMNSFKKVLKINLLNLLEELKEEQNLRILKEDIEYIKKYEERIKQSLKHTLSL